jgi:RNA polymerase sigma-70 factor (ECF subfamily)
MSNEGITGSSKPADRNAEVRTEVLLGRVAERDAEALGSLYDRFAPKLMGLLVRILSSRSGAETALQEVFLRLWKEAPSLAQSKGSVAAWLVLMARNEGFQRLRAQRAGAGRLEQDSLRQGQAKHEKQSDKSLDSTRREHKLRERPTSKNDSQTLMFLAASPELWLPQPEDIASVDARLGLLQRAINQMPKPQRRALELAFFDAYTESEIAAQLAEPLGKVNAGLRAAFTFLRHRQHAVLGTWTADI